MLTRPEEGLTKSHVPGYVGPRHIHGDESHEIPTRYALFCEAVYQIIIFVRAVAAVIN